MPSRNTKKALPKAKPATTKSKSGSRNGKATKKATQSRKRAATESESDGESQSEDEPTSKVQGRKKARIVKKKDRSESDNSEEVEEVEDVNPPSPPTEVISDDEEANSAKVNRVSKKIRVRAPTHKSHTATRGMPVALTSISVGRYLKINL